MLTVYACGFATALTVVVFVAVILRFYGRNRKNDEYAARRANIEARRERFATMVERDGIDIVLHRIRNAANV